MHSDNLRNLLTFLVLATLWLGNRWIRNDFRPSPPLLNPQPHLQINSAGQPVRPQPAKLRLDALEVNP